MNSRKPMIMFLPANTASTNARHPSVLQKPHSSEMNASDKLRRVAIKNSYSQCQSRVGTPHDHLRRGTFLPPLYQKRISITPAAVGNRKQHSTNPLILDVPCVRDDPQTALSRGSSRQPYYVVGSHSPLSDYESQLQAPCVHSSSDMNMGSGTLRRCSSHRNIAARRTNVIREAVRAGYRSANCQTKNDFKPMQRRVSSCFNVAVLKPNATVHQSARPRSPAPMPPCSTTALDFAVCQHLVQPSSRNTVRRVSTPRGNNPHPIGLEFQSPYNRECKTFEIWNPDIGLVENRLPHMLQHIDDTNFTSGKTNPFFQEKDGPPVVHYSKTSMYRCYYQRPQEAQGYDVTVPTTRFGSSPNQRPAVGIVPNAVNLRVPARRQQVRLHPPRGNKVASLV